VSRSLRKKQAQLKRQLASSHSGPKVASKRRIRNAVLEAITKWDPNAEKKELKKNEKKKSEKEKQADNGTNSHSLLGEVMEDGNEKILQTSHDEDDQRLPTENAVQEQIVQTDNEGIGDGDDDSPKLKAPKMKLGRKRETTADSDDDDAPLKKKLLKKKEPKGKRKEKTALEIPYADKLRTLSRELSTQEQTAALEHLASRRPRLLGRTASDVHGYRYSWPMTNGYTTQHCLQPSADARGDYRCHARLTDLSQGEIVYMSGQHLVWLNPKHDELLSYSNELLFLIVHALGRLHTGQRGVTIQYINCDEATTPDGQPAAFYEALGMYSTFKIDEAVIWNNYNKSGLNPRKFTHEYLSHGTIMLNDLTLKQARLEVLIRDGLFDLMPELYVPHNQIRKGLYSSQVVYRRIGYPPRKAPNGEPSSPIYSYDECLRSIPLTKKTLTLARKLALNFVNVPAGTDPATVEPPLHIFVQFLTLHKRNNADPAFLTWIRDHYDGKAEKLTPNPSRYKANTLISYQQTPSRPSTSTPTPAFPYPALPPLQTTYRAKCNILTFCATVSRSTALNPCPRTMFKSRIG
jgi:hypothetical protein